MEHARLNPGAGVSSARPSAALLEGVRGSGAGRPPRQLCLPRARARALLLCVLLFACMRAALASSHPPPPP
jgi:hypothetical protein